jgi:cellobiose-specific phosphotransferase system component IIC
MEKQALPVFFICLLLLAADFYLIGGVRIGLKKWKFSHKKVFTWVYWGLSIVIVSGVFISIFVKTGLGFRSAFLLSFFLMVIGKVMFLPFILADDIRRLVITLRR